MHILLTNDDGPPSNQSSPYVHTLVKSLQQAGHEVSVCLPNVQRSWIGKAHMIGQTLNASFFRPGTILKDDGILSERRFDDGGEEWILVDGTPASCVQIGLHHVFKDKGPVDLVLSGPNYGRNTTAVFALSSGTLGGAMEGAVNGFKSIALSYAFDSRDHDADIIAAASRISTRLIEKLVKEWPEDVHVYSINVPLRQGVENTKILYTEMIQNRWTHSSFTEVPSSSRDTNPNEAEKNIRDSQGDDKPAQNVTSSDRTTFKWSPQFADIRKSVEESGQGDGWAVVQGYVSVTALRANFWHVSRLTGEIKLEPETANLASGNFTISTGQDEICAVVDHQEPYVQSLIIKALESSAKPQYRFIKTLAELPNLETPVVQLTAYEALDFEHANTNPSTSLLGAYVIRKALIRKHYLTNTVATWLAKHPESILKKHFKPAVHFELDYAEFLEEALVDAWDLNESMQRNDEIEDHVRQEWWILKPGMSDGGNGIRLFSTMSQLEAIFEAWDPDEDEDEDEDEGTDMIADQPTSGEIEATNRVMTSQLRHFIAQPYIAPPLLLPALGSRKFHVRAYVVAVGALRIYVCREMLALFASKPYQPPGTPCESLGSDLERHLTNTCFQDESTKFDSVHRFWDLDASQPKLGWQQHIFTQICAVTGEVMEAAAREQMIHFQTLPNAFEIFGVDYLLDADLNVWLLELNAYPDFKQTGASLQDVVVGGLFEDVVKVAVNPFFGHNEHREGTSRLPLVREIVLGRT